MMEHSNEYQSLLDKFSGSKDLISLLEQCILEDERHRESYYLLNACYPQKRNLIMKLMIDLKLNEEREVK